MNWLRSVRRRFVLAMSRRSGRERFAPVGRSRRVGLARQPLVPFAAVMGNGAADITGTVPLEPLKPDQRWAGGGGEPEVLSAHGQRTTDRRLGRRTRLRPGPRRQA